MKILRALGLGVLIVILQILVPRVFHSVEETVVAAFNTAQVLMSVSQEVITAAKVPLLPPGK